MLGIVIYDRELDQEERFLTHVQKKVGRNSVLI